MRRESPNIKRVVRYLGIELMTNVDGHIMLPFGQITLPFVTRYPSLVYRVLEDK